MDAAATDWVALGTQAGLHAWPAFLALLALAVAGAGATTAWLTPHDRQHDSLRTGPRDRYLHTLGGSLVAGGVVVLATAAAFAAVARLLGDGRTLQRADEALSLHVTAETPAFALSAFRWLTHFGEPLVLIVMGIAVAIALWAGGRRGLALGWIAATAGNAVLNPALKQIFLRACCPRAGMFRHRCWPRRSFSPRPAAASSCRSISPATSLPASAPAPPGSPSASPAASTPATTGSPAAEARRHMLRNQ